MEKGIYLKINGGLCNRMRAIDSAVILMNLLNKKLFVIWENNNELSADFNDIFEPIPNVEVLSCAPKGFKLLNANNQLDKIKRMYYSIAPNIKNSEIKQYFKDKSKIESLKKYNFIFLETHHCFLYPEDFSFFIPKQFIFSKMKELLKNFENSPIIGLHVRRTDHAIAIEESPIYLFENAIRNEIHDNKAAKFFLATDDKDVKAYLKEMFGSIIVTNDFSLSRLNKIGIANAVIDLYMLAKTNKIYASHGSSFSQTAHHMQKSELIILKK